MRRFLALLLPCILLSACVSRPAPRQPAPLPAPKIHTPAPPKSVVPEKDAAPADLQQAIDAIWKSFPGKTGIAVTRVGSNWLVGKRLDSYFPQQSVSKTWVAMTVLDQVDKGILRMDQPVHIGKADLTLFHQPIRERVLIDGEAVESIATLLEVAITESDNTVNDSLLRTVGGPAAVRAFIVNHNLGKIRFGPGERIEQSETAGLTWQQDYSLKDNFTKARAALPMATRQAALNRYLVDPVDGASPDAIVMAITRLARGELLSPTSTQFLLNIMAKVKTGPNRLKAGVPSNWTFAHKTGTGQELGTVSTGYNDVGIMTAPDGARYVVAVLISDTTADIPARMDMMQSVSRAIANLHVR